LQSHFKFLHGTEGTRKARFIFAFSDQSKKHLVLATEIEGDQKKVGEKGIN